MSCHDYYSAERLQRTKNVVQALWFAKAKLPSAVRKETGEALDEVLGGVLPGILMALAIVAGSSLVGTTIGAIGGAFAGAGVGALPGAIAGGSVGFSAGMWILEWLGVAFLAVHVGKHMHQVTWLLQQGFNKAWGYGARDRFGLRTSDMMAPRHDSIPGFSEITQASDKFAQAVAIVIRLVLEGVVLYLTAKGVSKLPELVAQLRSSRLGEGFAVWVEKNHLRLMRNPKLNQNVGSAGVKPVKVLDHTGVPEQPRPGEVSSKTKPTEPYNRKKHYGRTPTKADRRVLGANTDEVVDHDPPLVKRYYEGDPVTDEKPGYEMTQEERLESANDRSRMQTQPKTESNQQGGEMSNYSKQKKKELDL